jgi:8-oxo-dGTP pyrophosphatase MutT (NUDIX family)
MLEAHEIPAYLHSGHLASVLPGVQIGAYNLQGVMVPEECASDAHEMLANFRAAPAPVGNGSLLRNIFEWFFFNWFIPSGHRPMQGGKPLASFVTVHDVSEAECADIAPPKFAVMLARASDGVVLVLSRVRKVWELPGGLIDPGESAREAAARELKEEAGCTADNVTWLGLVEVDDGATHFGAVFACDVKDVPANFENQETVALGRWRRGDRPRPLGESDAGLLNRFG